VLGAHELIVGIVSTIYLLMTFLCVCPKGQGGIEVNVFGTALCVFGVALQ